MDALTLFLPCPSGVEDYLADEVFGITALSGQDLMVQRGGVRVRGDFEVAMRLNLMSRLAQRVLIEVGQKPYRSELDLYEITHEIAWEEWFGLDQTFRVDLTAQASPLNSLNFATLRVKDAIVDRFRARTGGDRPNVHTHTPQVRVQAHLSATHATLYIDTSGQPLFKRGWRQDKGEAPLKESLAAAMLAACGWWQPAQQVVSELPLFDPCCGSGTIVIEAAQIALGVLPGAQRQFGFMQLLPFRQGSHSRLWQSVQQKAAQQSARAHDGVRIFGSDVAHRMVDFAQRNAQRAGVSQALQFRGGDALQRLPPCEQSGVLILNPPYGERIATAGVAGQWKLGRQNLEVGHPGADSGQAFYTRLAAHWKTHFAGWVAWVLTPDRQLPSRLHLSASRRVPLWNGSIECRLLRFEISGRDPNAQPRAAV